MASSPQGLFYTSDENSYTSDENSYTSDENSYHSVGSSLNNNDFPSFNPSESVNPNELWQGNEEDGNFDTTDSVTAPTSTHEGAPDVVDEHAPDTLANSSFNIPLMNNREVLGGEISSSLPAPNYEPLGALNAASAYGPSSLGPPNMRQRSQGYSVYLPFDHQARKLPPLTVQDFGSLRAPDTASAYGLSSLGPPNMRQGSQGYSLYSSFGHQTVKSPPPPAQDFGSLGASDAASAYGPTPLGPPTLNKRKRSNEEEASSPPAPKTRQRETRNPSLHHFSGPGEPNLIFNGRPIHATLAPAPAKVPVPACAPSGSKTAMAAGGLGNPDSSERYLDSHRLRQLIKSKLANTKGIRQGERWEVRLSGGVYLIECLHDQICSMQWFGEVVLV